MNIGIVGLGLIGGSFARALKAEGHIVYACDISEETFSEAILVGAADDKLNDETLPLCDFVIVAVYPKAAEKYITENAALFKKDCYVIDAAGVKVNLCKKITPLAKKHGFIFMGGHPMAGTQFSGFKHSRGSLFKDASMILVNSYSEEIDTMQYAKNFFLKLGFSEVVFTSAEEHDSIIAFTSQLAHVVSNAYVKSPRAEVHKGFSAGSYKDLTRVARLNENMWCELFLENRENLIEEIECLIENLSEYRDAISAKDKARLTELLKTGRERKEQIERSPAKYNPI